MTLSNANAGRTDVSVEVGEINSSGTWMTEKTLKKIWKMLR
jgi:hypothetical protein